MKVYYGKNRKGVWKASLDYEKVKRFDNLCEAELPVVHNKVYMIRTYYGFDYNYGGVNPIYDVIKHSTIYHSVHELKNKCEVWKDRESKAKENPDKYHVTPFSIATDDFGEPFMYGDVMQGGFNMKIIGIKVV
ncbi:MAG: hypothetical protein K2H53_02270 [Clostridia bacterium]|nr:hypothetical protein [Clostridia bacterium]